MQNGVDSPVRAGEAEGLIVHPATPRRKVDGRRVGLGLLIAGALMVPWLYVLCNSLPDTTRVSGWSTAWVGLDVMEAFALLGTGLLLVRRDARVSPVAAVTSALLLVDVWFDVTTSSSGHALVIAAVMAVFVELPLCALCALIAGGALRRSPLVLARMHCSRLSLELRRLS
jgi:hypothetical protein